MALKRRVVVAGLGSIGRRHTRLLFERDDVSVEVVEPRVEALASVRKELGDLPSHRSFEAMLETTPDVVWIATPTPLHAAQSISALNAGAHVFCEKPMTDSLVEAIRVKELADRSKKVFNVGFYLHFWPVMVALKDLISRGVLGQVLHAHARVGTYITLVNSASRYQAHQSGSLFWDYSHQPDLFYWLLGKIPKAVHASAFQGGALELSSNPNVAVVTCEYESPLISTVHLNYVQMPERDHYELCGDEGWAFIDWDEAIMTIGTRKNEHVETKEYPIERDDIFRAEHRAFFDTLNGARSSETSATDGLVSTAICEAAIESWKTRQRIALKI
ncbi:MAG: Gfo/Idh/MocA family oxidoreductase [Candidatus Acidiferrales bacterium]